MTRRPELLHSQQRLLDLQLFPLHDIHTSEFVYRLIRSRVGLTMQPEELTQEHPPDVAVDGHVLGA